MLGWFTQIEEVMYGRESRAECHLFEYKHVLTSLRELTIEATTITSASEIGSGTIAPTVKQPIIAQLYRYDFAESAAILCLSLFELPQQIRARTIDNLLVEISQTEFQREHSVQPTTNVVSKITAFSAFMAAVKRALQAFWQAETKTPVSSDSQGRSTDYNKDVETFRDYEYPTLVGTTYLDHAGTTPYPKSAIENWTAELTSNLFGNPHSASASSQLTTRRIEDIRLKVLRFFDADPDHFSVVFVANATAAIKLVGEAFRDNGDGFRYSYHSDSHTSLIGCRELAAYGSKCFLSDEVVEQWLDKGCGSSDASAQLGLFGYPGQSNLTGRILPGDWPGRVRKANKENSIHTYTLLDAASLAATSHISLADVTAAPDFLCVSFYKIFGFPDLGALIIRNESAGPLLAKRYFGGGNVDAVTSEDSPWHARKRSIHAALEEGTLPFHNILALDHAMTAYNRLYGSVDVVSRHARHLRNKAKKSLCALRHSNNTRVCEIYEGSSDCSHGSVLSFNLKGSSGLLIGASEVEKLCIVKGIQLRAGGMCNPGGIANHLQLSSEQIQSNYNAGRRCGGESGLLGGRPTGVLRISFGAMSTEEDLQSFINFVREYYVEHTVLSGSETSRPSEVLSYYIESLHVYPIKSCASFQIRPDQNWPITPKGLAWDRQWCLVHAGSNTVLNQKSHPRMALLRPRLDLMARKMFVETEYRGEARCVSIDLDDADNISAEVAVSCSEKFSGMRTSKMCGDVINLHWYTSDTVNNFFTEVLDVPCRLARYPADSSVRTAKIRKPARADSSNRSATTMPQIMLANESPILLVSRPSIQELSRQIRLRTSQTPQEADQPVSASSFRANIVVAQQSDTPDQDLAYAEDSWSSISIWTEKQQIHPVTDTKQLSPTTDTVSSDASSRSVTTNKSGLSESNSLADQNVERTNPPYQEDYQRSVSARNNFVRLDILGPCQRCQMVGINQATAKTQQEPFSTLAKTRRKGDGRVWFGVHAALSQPARVSESYVRVGDLVIPS